MLDFRSADPERQRPQRPVRRGVAVAADDRDARLRQPLLRADDVDDPLARVERVIKRHAELLAVGAQRLNLLLRERIRKRLHPRVGRHVVILRGDRQLWPSHPPPREAQPLERLRRSHLMHEVQVDVEQVRLALRLPHQVRVPDFLRDGSSGHRLHPSV